MCPTALDAVTPLPCGRLPRSMQNLPLPVVSAQSTKKSNMCYVSQIICPWSVCFYSSLPNQDHPAEEKTS